MPVVMTRRAELFVPVRERAAETLRKELVQLCSLSIIHSPSSTRHAATVSSPPARARLAARPHVPGLAPPTVATRPRLRS